MLRTDRRNILSIVTDSIGMGNKYNLLTFAVDHYQTLDTPMRLNSLQCVFYFRLQITLPYLLALQYYMFDYIKLDYV